MKRIFLALAILMAMPMAAETTTANTTKTQCTAITKKGEQCKNKAQEGKTTCGVHTPVADADRCKATTKAGEQCKRKHNANGQYCTQHEKSLSK